MDAKRAGEIAQGFERSRNFSVRPKAGGLLVQYRGNTTFFVREACFWPYIFRVASNDEKHIVMDIEARLAA